MKCSISRSTAKRAIAELVKNGIILKENCKKNNVNRSNIYTVLPPCHWIGSEKPLGPGDRDVGSRGPLSQVTKDRAIGSRGPTNYTNISNYTNITDTNITKHIHVDDSDSKFSNKETPLSKEKAPDNTPAEKKLDSNQEQLSLKGTVSDNNTPVGKKTNKGKETLPVKENDSNDNPLVSKADLIAVLGDTLREVWDGPPAKAYAIAGTLYNRYDYIAAEEAVNVFHRRKKEGFQPKNPVAYLMKIARETKKRYDNADKDGNASNYKESPDNRLTFAEKYPEEHKRRMEEVKRVYAEREQYHKEYIALNGEDPPVAIPGFITPGQVLEQMFGKGKN